MKTIIHVNQHVIRRNAKGLSSDPPLTVKDYKQNRKCVTAEILVDGAVVARVVYSPNKPLACGARCWIETDNEVRTQ